LIARLLAARRSINQSALAEKPARPRAAILDKQISAADARQAAADDRGRPAAH
jgi:hypothetical protein